jgi:hypothetical protein
MVHRQQRHTARHGQCLGADQTDHNAADQARPGGGGNRIEIGESDSGFVQHRLDHRREFFGMGARGNFRNHAAIRRVLFILRSDPLGENLAFAGDQRRRSLVAA